MVITNYAKEQVALRIGSDISSPLNMVIGTGSTAATITDIALGSEVDKQAFTNVNMSGAQTLIFQGDWNSVEMSGIQLAEWGITSNAVAATGSIWSRQAFDPITFDGTNELQIEETWEVY